jgi:hypothetical protein
MYLGRVSLVKYYHHLSVVSPLGLTTRGSAVCLDVEVTAKLGLACGIRRWGGGDPQAVSHSDNTFDEE